MPGSDELPQRRVSKSKKTGEMSSSQFSDTSNSEMRAIEDNTSYDDDDDDNYADPTRSHSTSIRRTNLGPPSRTTAPQISPIPQRRTGRQAPRLEPPATSLPVPAPLTGRPPYAGKSITRHQTPPDDAPKGKVHWLLPLGIGMIAMLVLWVLGSAMLAWGLARYDDLRYGNPRTYQTDAVVGHNDSPAHPSHFIAINLNRQAIVIEFPGGNPNGAQSYVVPSYILGQDPEQVVVTLEFRNVTGHGKLDMIIHMHLQTQDQTFVFVNTGSKFRPPNANDNIHL